MKRAKRRTRLFTLALSLVFTFSSISFSALAGNISQPTTNLDGIEFSANDFDALFGSSEAVQVYSDNSANEFTPSDLTISDISISNNTISLNAVLTPSDAPSISFAISGEIYTGYKAQVSNLKSLVLDASPSASAVKVLLFELTYGSNDINLMVNDSLIDSSNLKIYLLYNNSMYLFEIAMPAEFLPLEANDYPQMTDPLKDFLWFAPYSTPTVETLPAEDAEQETELAAVASAASARATSQWSANSVYQTTFTASGKTYVQTSIPFGNYRIDNVTNSSSSWHGEFRISESTKIDGTGVSGYENLVKYKNVQVSIVAGKNTEFETALVTGCVFKNSTLGSNTTSAALDFLSAIVSWWDIGKSAVSVISSLVDTGTNLSLGGSGYTAFVSGVTGTGISLPSNHIMYNNSYTSTASPAHYIVYRTYQHSTTSADAAAVSTSGCIHFKWDAYLSSDFTVLDTNATQVCTVAYTSQY